MTAKLGMWTLIGLFLMLGSASSPADEAPAPSAPAVAPCPAEGQLVLVDTVAHRLQLCDRGTSAGTFAVALGEGGIGKTREGDKKTPLGRYSLAAPRRSTDGYYTFIPVGYPTAAQRKAGMTGGAVGIHGPPERMPEFEDAVTSSDWTWGCIALARGNLATVVTWVRDHKVQTVELVAGPT